MNGNMEKLSEKKLSQYNEVLSLMESDQKNVNYNDSWEYKLLDLANKIINRLKVEIPEITRKNEIVFIKEEKYIRALTLFLAYFQDYLSLEIITSLENAIDAHLVKLYERFESCNKDIIDITKESVGITIIGYTSDNKHIGDIDIRLQKRGIKVVYLCNSMRAYENLKERIEDFKALVLIAHPIYYAYISRVKVLLSTNDPLPLQKMNNIKTKIIHLGHNFNEALQYTLWRTDKNYVFNSLKRERLDRSHYVVAHTKNDYKVLQKTCEYFNIDEDRILKGGNPSLDWTLHKYKESVRLKGRENKRYLLLAPSYLENFLGDCQIVSILEQIMDMGIFLVIRPHPLHIQRDCMKYHGILDDWSRKYSNFKIDDSQKYFNEYLINSFTLLTDESSMGVSYPYFTLRPSLIYIKEARRKGIGIDGIRLYNASLNILIDDFNELRKNILKLSSRGGGDENSNIIQKFRDQQVYNLMNSSCYLSNLIEKML